MAGVKLPDLTRIQHEVQNNQPVSQIYVCSVKASGFLFSFSFNIFKNKIYMLILQYYHL